MIAALLAAPLAAKIIAGILGVNALLSGAKVAIETFRGKVPNPAEANGMAKVYTVILKALDVTGKLIDILSANTKH